MEPTNMHLIRLPEVLAICGLSRSTVYAYAKRGQFPSQIKITPNAAGWVKEEVQAWVESRVRANRGP
ncbi:AlpA family transcriptional regulator [Duganella sp. BJB1802]|uniref:helix-turn-helix transcriptional regulator n=2 Tax=unclassified Duganella TaxID=2636909 RepID=UPI001E648964|nr:AlpA family transcriptional regulator [Duganella sp. BJB1802]